MKKTIRLGALSLLAYAAATQFAAADNFPWSQSPPGGLDAKTIPMFVCFGIDDNARVEGVDYIAGLMRSRKNPAGTGNPQTYDGDPVRATWFLTASFSTPDGLVDAGGQTVSDLVQSLKAVVDDGHEIGNHTWDHPHGSGLTLDQWKDQITRTNDHLVSILGIKASDILGFRTPFLEYNPSTQQALKDLGFMYDASIEFGFNGWQPVPPDTGYWNGMTNPETIKKLFWPYTLDKGSPPGNASKGNPTVAGLWEVPVFTHLKPDNSGEVTGFDFNLWNIFDKATFVATLKHNFELRRAGNRDPMTVSIHSDYYTQYNVDANAAFTLADWKQRQAGLQEFLDYVLSFPDVRVVPYKSMIAWMKNPVALGNAPGTGITQASLRSALLSFKLASPTTVDLSLPAPGAYTLTVASVQGKVLSRVSGRFARGQTRVGLKKPLTAGVYLVKLSDGVHTARQRVVF